MLKIAIQMDAIESINIAVDSTYALALEAQSRGDALFYYRVEDLFLDQGCPKATIYPLQLFEIQGQHYTLGEPENPPMCIGEIRATANGLLENQ